MTATKLLTLLIAALLVTAGAGTVVAAEGTATATNTSTDAPDADDGTDTDDGNETDTDEEADTGLQNASDLGVDASYDNGTVALAVTTNGTPAEGVAVTANGEDAGETNANGTVTFEFDANSTDDSNSTDDANATEELELTLTGETFTAEYVYSLEDGTLTLESNEVQIDGDDGRKGPSENANERAHTVWQTIQQWMSGERAGNLGALIQEAFGHNGSNGNADERGTAAENGKSNGKKPAHAAQKDKDDTGHANGKQKDGETNGHGHGTHSDDDETATDA